MGRSSGRTRSTGTSGRSARCSRSKALLRVVDRLDSDDREVYTPLNVEPADD